MTNHAITIEIDDHQPAGYTDEVLAACWDGAQKLGGQVKGVGEVAQEGPPGGPHRKGKTRGNYRPKLVRHGAEVPAADRGRAPGDAGPWRADRPVLQAPVAGRQRGEGRGQ